MSTNNKVLLVILDGLGYSPNKHGNAVLTANTKNLDYLTSIYSHGLISASGVDVGLPTGQMGNSEVGHLNIGAGRIVYTGLSLINKAIDDGEFDNNQAFVDAIKHAKNNKSNLHIMGLVSPGGVHSSYNHIIELLKLAHKHNISPILDIFSDGRDVDPKAFLNYIDDLINECNKYNTKIASISGRYYAMDRDKRWERTSLAYDNLIGQPKVYFSNLKQYVESEYKNNRTDEFIIPAFNKNYDLNEIKLQDNDAIIFANFRPDRARQLCHYIHGSNLYDVTPSKKLKNIFLVTMAQYEGIKPNAIAFPPMKLNHILGQVIESNNLKQLRIAETEKYAHVTFFFDGGKEIDYKNEQKILINSPKVATYDLKPSMSANEITNALLPTLGKYDFTVVNYANCDMVGHTGNFDATVKAVECVDKQIGILYQACTKNNVTMFIIADHGNAELMLNEQNKPVTKHTSNKVPFILTDKNYQIKSNGKLANIAPSILSYMDIAKPKEMNEDSIITRK